MTLSGKKIQQFLSYVVISMLGPPSFGKVIMKTMRVVY